MLPGGARTVPRKSSMVDTRLISSAGRDTYSGHYPHWQKKMDFEGVTGEKKKREKRRVKKGRKEEWKGKERREKGEKIRKKGNRSKKYWNHPHLVSLFNIGSMTTKKKHKRKANLKIYSRGRGKIYLGAIYTESNWHNFYVYIGKLFNGGCLELRLSLSGYIYT